MRKTLPVLFILALGCAHAQATPEKVSASALGQSKAEVCRQEPDGSRTCARAEGGAASGNLLNLFLGAVTLCTKGVCPI